MRLRPSSRTGLLASLLVTAFATSPTLAADPPGTVRVIPPGCGGDPNNMTPISCYHPQTQALNNTTSFLVYKTDVIDQKFYELNKQLVDLQDGLSSANQLVEQQRQTIETLSSGLSRQISSLPTGVAADAKLVGLLREQLQAEFDSRYEQKRSP